MIESRPRSKLSAAYLWNAMQSVSTAYILIVAAFLSAFEFLLSILVFHLKLPAALLAGPGFNCGIMLASIPAAALLALFGLLFRGTFNMRPLFLGILVLTLLTNLINNLLIPFSSISGFDLVAKFLIFPLAFLANICFWTPLTLTTFPHRWFGRMRWAALIICVLAAFQQAKVAFTEDHSEANRKLFEAEPALAHFMAGASVSTSRLGAEIAEPSKLNASQVEKAP